MKNRSWLLVIIVLTLLSLTLAGCERDRPAPAPAQATTAPKGTVAPTPPPIQTKTGLPASGSPTVAAPIPGGAATAVPPAKLNPPTPTAPPPKTAAPVSTTPQAGQAGSQQSFAYVVKAGDTLGEIAQKFKTTSQAILALNPMADPNVLAAGQELKIPGELPVEMGGLSSYTVQQGDMLSVIAERLKVSVEELKKVNNIADADQIFPGQQLRIPGGAVAPSGTSQSYTIRSGDTLSTIATRLGVTMAALQAANNITNPNAIYAGQVLKIP